MLNLKKIVSVVSVLAIAMTTMAFSTVTSMAAETNPKVTFSVSYPDGTAKAGDRIAIKATTSGFDNTKVINSGSFRLTIPTDYVSYFDISSLDGQINTELANALDPTKNSFGFNTLKNFFNMTLSNVNKSEMALPEELGTWTIKLAKDLADAEIDLTKTQVKIILADDTDFTTKYTYNYSATTTSTLDVVLDTIKAPAEVIPTATEATPVYSGSGDFPANAATATAIGGTYVSDTDPTDTAVAYGVGLKGDNVNTYSKVIWKVTANGVTKGHEMTLNTPIGGEGTAKVGLAIQGLTAGEVTSVQAAFGN